MGANEPAFGSVLRRYRTAAGLSQQALAHRARVSLQAVSALESGRRRAPYRDTVERLAAALELEAGARAEFKAAAKRARAEDPGPTTAERRHNLPRELTSFVGRDEVVAHLEKLVVANPLVTVIGTGGVGKTRVAVQVGARTVSHWRDGVCFVELASISDPALVASAIASALRIVESPTRPVLATLTGQLKKKRLLLILDNCEHVIQEAARVAAALLQACPDVAILATSREALSLAGEWVYRVPSLDVPARGHLSAQEATEYGAVTLFSDRGSAAGSFALDDASVPAVAEICRRLDGIPLAIELAAARLRALSPEQIAQRLDERFNLLTSGDRSALPRQQTMRALIDWSYELLSPRERILFARLAVFVGGFTLEAATRICAGGRIDEQHVAELVVSLVDKSLLIADATQGEPRYRLLESTRQYAAEKLAERCEEDMLSRRHAETYLALAEQLDTEWYLGFERAWFRKAQPELDNWRAALKWSLERRGDVAVGQRLAGAMVRVWYTLAAAEGRRWVRVALDTTDDATPDDVQFHLCITEAELHGAFGQYKTALEPAEHALELARRMADPFALVHAMQNVGAALAALGRGDDGEPLLHDALEGARRLRNRRLAAMLLGEIGTARSRRGDLPGARAFYAQALAHYQALGVARQAASVAGHLAEVEYAGGDAEMALLLAHEALAGHRAAGNMRSIANLLCNQTAYLVALHRYEEALVCGIEALHASRDVEATVLTAWALQHLAALAALRSSDQDATIHADRVRAAHLLGYVEAQVAALDVVRDYTEQREYERLITALDAAKEHADVAAARLRARDWTEEEAIAETLAL